jgi:pyrroloquinoline quinone biosynthesis protein B
LVNASPDLRQQIARTPDLHPKTGMRHTPISAVLLTNADVDHVAGLLCLRENQAFRLFGTAPVLDSLAANDVFNVLSQRHVTREIARPTETFEPLAGLSVTLLPVPGKVPLWLESEDVVIGEVMETTVAVMIDGGGCRLAYVPGCALVTETLRQRLQGVDVLLFDGTVLFDDDMIRAGVGEKTGWRMGHVPMMGDRGSIKALAEVSIGQRIFVHINNTNPVLIEGSPERALVESAGWQIAYDGMMLNP